MKSLNTLMTYIAAFTLLSSIGYAAPAEVTVSGQARFTSTAPLEKIVGTAPVQGQFSIDFEAPKVVSGKFTVPVKGMKTGNETRDEHLRGEEWLNAEKCESIVFEAKSGEVTKFQSAKESDKGITSIKLLVKGAITINCITKPLEANVIIKRKGNITKIGSSSIEVKLADFDVKGKEGIVGKKVGETIKINLNLKGK